MQGLVGRYEGGGTFTLFRIRSFESDLTRRTPIGFVEMDTRDFLRTSSLGVIHYHEIIEYWFLEESNLLALNTFIGVGYCKMVKRAFINSDGTMIRDATGEPDPTPDESQPKLHSECGYIIAFTARNGVTTIMKVVDIARGLTVLAMGSFSSNTNTFEFDTDTLDGSDFGIFDTPFGTANRVTQVNYHQTLVTSAGTVNCGAGCTPARHEYDEFFRMNARRSDGS